MEPINVNLSCDLQHPVKVQYLDGYFFSKDSAGHKINVDVFDNGVPVSVGGSVSADVIRSDGETVPVTGAVSENRAYVILPQAAYAVVGAAQITIKVTEGTTIVTIASFVVYVHESDTGIIVDPGTIIPSIQALISQIETAVASIPADYSSLWTSLAPAFSTSTAYAVGQYVTNSGVLYRFTTAHPAGTWNSAHVTAVNLGSDISALKSAKSDWAAVGFNQWDEKWEVGGINGTTGQNTVTTGTIRSKNYIPVIPGAKYYFKSPVKCWWHSYGADKSYLGVINYGSSFKDEAKTLGNGVYFLRFQGNAYGNTYNNDICVNLFQDDTSIDPHNGQYYPYSENFHVLNRLIGDEKNVNAISEKIGNTSMGTTASTVTGAIAEHEGDIVGLLAADTTLSSNLTAFKNSLQAQIDALGNQVNNLEPTISEAINEEKSSRAEADADLQSAIATLETQTNTQLSGKLNSPTNTGTQGQTLRNNGSGGTEWADVGLPTDEQTEEAVRKWMDDNPSASTTVQDHSLTHVKLVNGTLGFITPDMYGAVGDGETDDTTALKTMFENSANVVVVFPKGKTYIISPDSESPSSAIFLLTGKVIIYGNGSTLKIADGSGGYGAIFGCSTNDVTGSMIDGLIFDHNSTNCQNFTVNSSKVLDYARITFAAEICYQFVFRNNVIKNCACTNCLYFNKGLTIKNILVDGNRFDAIGKTPNNLYHDHSSLYIHGDNIKIINNKFSGESWGAEGAVTAIEVHPGNGCIIAHNTVEKYLNGINYTAVNDAESANGRIDSNIFNTLRHGVLMYSSQFHEHTTGYGINGLVITNNYVRIRNSLSLGYLDTNMDYGVGGIDFYHYTTLPIKDVYVTTNLLSYDIETVPGEGETPVHSMQYGAIGIFETNTGATLYENVIFDDITLINPPGICVAIGASMLGGSRGTIKNCRFSNITVINPCGVPYQYSGGGQNYRRGISCGGTQFIGDIEIDVKFLDADYTKMRYPITIASGNDSSSANINIRCSIKWSNEPTANDYLLVTRYDNNTVPKLKLDMNAGAVVANVTKFKAGSCIVNEATGKLYYMETDGTALSNVTASTLFERAIITEMVRL